jgi:hypothetical protein
MTAMFRFLTKGAGAAGAVIGAVAFIWSLAAAAAPLEIDGASVPWTRLMFRPPERPDDLAVEVTLDEVPAEQLAAVFGADPNEKSKDDSVGPAGATVWRLTSTMNVLYTGQVYRSEVWFSPGAGAPLLRYRDKLGREANRKAYRYLEDGVRRRRIEPDGSAEADLPPERWSRIKEHFFPYGPSRADCPVLLDPNLLFLVASAETVGRTDGPTSFCVFNKKTIYRVELTPGSDERLPVAYVERKAGAQREVHGQASVRTLRLDAQAAADSRIEPETFEFFEMVGTIEIDLDAASGLPLRISGQIGAFGQVVVELAEADLRP